jgi:transcriptional regulator with XRE-family HTH domain
MATNWHDRKKTLVRIAFGKEVRRRRLELSLTQESLAELAGLHPTYLGSVERGERNISLENIISLARALKCSPRDLMPR